MELNPWGRISLVAQTVKNPPAMQEIWDQSLDWEDPLRKGNSYPLPYSGLENSMDRGAWQATVHGVTKSWTRLSNFYFLSLSVSFNICSIYVGPKAIF